MAYPPFHHLITLLRRLVYLSRKPLRLIAHLWTILRHAIRRSDNAVKSLEPSTNPTTSTETRVEMAYRPDNVVPTTYTTLPSCGQGIIGMVASSHVPQHFVPTVIDSRPPSRVESPHPYPPAASRSSIGSIQIEGPDASEWNSSLHIDTLSVNGWRRRSDRSPHSDYASSGTSVASEAPNRTAIPGLGNAASMVHLGGGPITPLAHPSIKPLLPECYNRYDKNIVMSKKIFDHDIPPLTTNYLTSNDPDAWISYVHPEGALYFFHPVKRIFTDANLFDEATLWQVENYVRTIYQHMEDHNIVIDTTQDNVDLVLDLLPVAKGSKDLECYYYFADHATRTVFHLDTIKARDIPVFPTIKGVQSFSQIRHAIEAQFWWHCLLFPRCFNITDAILEQFRDTVLFFISDIMSSPSSTSPYSMEDLQYMLSMINNLKKNIGTQYGGCAAAIGRMLNEFAIHKFHHFHGEPAARLDRYQSIYGNKSGRRGWLAKLVSPILFSGPDVYLRTFEKIWIDDMIHHTFWTKFVEKLVSEWSEEVLYATVLLNANVAFLAIQSIDTDSEKTWYRSPAQLASYTSTTFSIGCIITGLLLMRQKRTKAKETVDDVIIFLRQRKNSTFGIEHLAAMYSLPYALLMWGMLAFVVAFTCVFFINTTVATRALLGSVTASIFVIAIWCVWMGWETYDYDEDDDEATEETMRVPAPDLEDTQQKENEASEQSSTVRALKTSWFNTTSIRNSLKSPHLPWRSTSPSKSDSSGMPPIDIESV